MKKISLILTLLLLVPGFLIAQADTDVNPDQETPEIIQKTRRPPVVVMKQTNIKGKVFFLTEKDDNDAVAENLLIQLSSLDNNSVIYETATDTNGVYSLPDLDTGNYGLNIGLLKMELIVEDPETVTRNISTLPKNIIVFIPRAMEKKAIRKRH